MEIFRKIIAMKLKINKWINLQHIPRFGVGTRQRLERRKRKEKQINKYIYKVIQ